MKKVLITDDIHPYLAQKLSEHGFEVDVLEKITNEETFEIINLYTGLIVSTKINVTQKLIDKASELKFIARAGSGMDNIDVDYAREKKIDVVSSPEGNSNAVAEHALGMLLALTNNIALADREMRNNIWQREKNRGIELDGKTIAIIGYGNTGSAFAKKLAGFNIKILVHDKYKSGFAKDNVIESNLETIYNEAIVISLHLPLTKETFHYADEHFFDAIKNPFYFINTSRGKIVNTKNLIACLHSKKCLGAALDVFENESFSSLYPADKNLIYALKNFDNIILTPHIAGWSVESKFKIAKVLFDKINLLPKY